MKSARTATRSPQILSGWKEIANYLGKGVRTVQRYERLHGFPVRRPAGKPWGSVVATTAEIDAWVEASPLRDELWLLRDTKPVTASWAEIQKGAAEMRKLAQQMRELRNELRTSVGALRSSVFQFRQGLHGSGDGRNSFERQANRTKALFTLLQTNLGGGRSKGTWGQTDEKRVS
jgi:hypothetical protein